MAKLLKLRRGTTSQHSSFTGAEGEVTIDTDKDTAVVHDGSTAAGRPLAREDLNNVASASITGRLSSGAIAGAKIANGAITSAHIAADTVVAADIAANAVGTSEIAANAVTGNEIADDAINTEHYVDGSIDRVHLSNDIIDGTKIADNAIGAEHLAGNSVGSSEIIANSVTSTEIADDAVGASQIADNGVVTAGIANNAVTMAKLSDLSQNKIIGRVASGTGDATHLSASDVRTMINVENGATADQTSTEIKSLLASDNIGAAHIANNSIGSGELANDSVSGDHIVDNAINSEHYVDRSIDAVHIASNSITANEIAANAVGSSELASNAVTDAKITNSTISGSKIAGDAINGTHIGDDVINSEHIADGSIDEPHLNISNSGSNGQALTKAGSGFTWATISPDGGNAATVDGIDSSSFLRSDAADTATNDITFASGGGAVTIAGSSDIRLTNGNWTGNTTDPKIQAHSSQLYICGGSGGIMFRENGTNRFQINGDGHVIPTSNNTYDLGSSGYRWRNIYTNDLNLSNEGSVNDVDGTWGNYTIQEGEDELFLLNRRNGKKYKFNLTEVN